MQKMVADLVGALPTLAVAVVGRHPACGGPGHWVGQPKGTWDSHGAASQHLMFRLVDLCQLECSVELN